jgi:sec-independent protein translocase protein TatA
MGIPGISWPQLLIILVLVLLIFGTKRIRNIGSDLGGAIREFRKGVGDNDGDSDGDDKSKEESSKPDDESGESKSSREH